MNRPRLLSLAILLPALLPSPVSAQSRTGASTSIDITLPDQAVLHCPSGEIRTHATTSLPPGRYQVHYDPGTHTLIAGPVKGTHAVLTLSLERAGKAEGKRYQACIAGMDKPVPLRVHGPAEVRDVPATALALDQPLGPSAEAQALGELRADALSQPWVPTLVMLGEQPSLTAEDVQLLLDAERGMSIKDAVLDPARAAQWEALPEWEKALWREYLDRYGDGVDFTAPDTLRLDHDKRLSMAMAISWRHVPDGMRDTARALFTDRTFVNTTMTAIAAYLMLWMAPEPIFSKATAVLSTFSLVTLAGVSFAEIMHLARAYKRLRDDVRQARTLLAIEAAGQRYGRELGGTTLRTLVAIGVVAGGSLAPRPPLMPPGAPVMAKVSGEAVTLGAVSVPRSVEMMQVLADGTVRLTLSGMTMSALRDDDGSDAVPEPSQETLSVVPRKGMDQRVVQDRNGQAVTLYGQNKSASRTAGHDELIEAEALRMAESGEYEYITMQRSWRTATGREVRSRRIPDIIGVRRNGKIDAVEIKSASDQPDALMQRLNEVMNALPDGRRGKPKILDPNP